MILGITPNLTPQAQPKNNGNMTFSAFIRADDLFSSAEAGFRPGALLRLEEAIKGFCGSDTFILSTDFLHWSTKMGTQITHFPHPSTKGLNAFTDILENPVGEEGILEWIKGSHQQWLKHNKA